MPKIKPQDAIEDDMRRLFSSRDSLIYLATKIDFLFYHQRYMVAALQRALKKSSMIGITGMEGIGKTSSIASFLLDNQAICNYIRIGESYTPKAFFDEMIFQTSGIFPPKGETIFFKVKRLSRNLTEGSHKRLMIIDDAGKLSPRGLGYFHELRDNTSETTGFVFVGLDYFKEKLDEAREKKVRGIGEFCRRVQSWITVPNGLKQNEIAEFCKKHGVVEEHTKSIVNSKTSTLAELEILVDQIQEAELELKPSNKEKPKPNPIPKKGNKPKKSKIIKDLRARAKRNIVQAKFE